MKSVYFFAGVMLFLSCLVLSCQDEKTKDNYSGVSELISDRNKARYEEAERSALKTSSAAKTPSSKIGASKTRSNSKQEVLSSIILYDEAVNIVGSDSGRVLAKGVASINKKGQVVRIKIYKE